MDAHCDPRNEEVVGIKAAQVGVTEALNNVVGYYIDHDPSPILYVQEMIEKAEDLSKERLEPMIRDTPCLTGKVADSKEKKSKNTIRKKQFPGGFLALAGANSAASLASRAVRVLLMDERGRYSASIGKEGDPAMLARERTKTYWNRVISFMGTPGIKGLCSMEAAYLRSDQRRFWVPCPECGAHQTLKWAQVKWGQDADGEHDSSTAYYECEHCRAHISDRGRLQMVRRGEWRAEITFKGIAGFHISSLYSPWVTLPGLVKKFLDTKGDPAKLQVFVNADLGETWEEKGEKVNEHTLMDRREEYPCEVPPGVAVITCGVDVQDNRIECEVVGWGRGEESWGLGYFVIMGDPDQQAVWTDLEKNVLQRVWIGTGNLRLPISATMIDTGGHRTQAVYNFVRPREGRRIYASKGDKNPIAPIVKRPAKTKNKGGVILWMIGTNAVKDALHARMTRQDPGPGYLHFPMQYEDGYFRQLTVEQRVTIHGRGSASSRWEKPSGARNEALDCRVGAFAALYALIGMGLKLDQEADRLERGGGNAPSRPSGRRVRSPGVSL